MARAETYGKPGTPPQIAPATINEDLRRRDFTVNAMALSLNPGSRGLLLDPFNGSADVEAKLIRVLHNYAFLEEPSRLIRATRFAARFHWELEERTKARYDCGQREQLHRVYNPEKLSGMKSSRSPSRTTRCISCRRSKKRAGSRCCIRSGRTAKVDQNEMAQWMKTRQLLQDAGYTVDAAPLAFYFLTKRMGGQGSGGDSSA